MQAIPVLPLSHIKVRIPLRRRELITRSRLIDGFYDQLDRQLIFVIAPAGYGKTSLLVDLAQQSELPFCWFSLDTLDQDPQRFVRYLIAAIAERFPNFGRDSLSALESMTSIENDIERLLVTITNDINSQIREHFVLVLDDFNLVGNIKAIGLLLSRFLQLAGENVHLVISSRNIPDLPVSSLLIARNQVGGVTFEDLAFLPVEIQQLFQQNNGVALNLHDAETLVKETEGWIAAIHLTHGQPGILPKLHPLKTMTPLFDFFTQEVMGRQSEEVRKFMLLTSMFDTFESSLCHKVLDPLVEGTPMDWMALIETVRSTNLFSIVLDSEGIWMRYHHLFQHFLKSQLQYEKPMLAWQIQKNLALVYEEEKKWEEALQIYEHLKDHHSQARLLIKVGMIFIGSGRILTLSNWLQKLPMDLAYSKPVLVSLMGAVLATQGDNRQALDLFNLAEADLRVVGSEVEWTETLARRAEVYRQLGQYDFALRDVEKIMEITEHSSIPEMQSTFAEAQRIKGLSLFGLGQTRDSLIWLEKSLQKYRLLGFENNLPILETELGVIQRRLGETKITERYYASALHALEKKGNTGWKARLLNNMGMLHYMTGDLENAHHLLDEAVQTAERCGYTRTQTTALISIGDLLSDLNDLAGAFLHYDKALTLGTGLGHSLSIFYAALGLARLKRLGGDPTLAIEELRQAELSQASLGSYERALYNFELGRCWLEENKMDAAKVVLQDSAALFGEGSNKMEQLVVLLWLEVAASHSSAGDTINRLKELIPPQRDWRKATPLMLQAGHASVWLKNKGGSPLLKDSFLRLFFEQAGRLLKTLPELREKVTPSLHPMDPDIPRLEIFSFGEMQVRSHQRVVELSTWQTREARDLFFYLLQSPPQTKEKIALEFWPDISTARLKMRFKINIYRIRQALGQDVILFKDDHYGFNRSIQYRWDRENFENLYRASQQKTATPERAKVLEQAISLLDRGTYLADLNAEWAVADRLLFEKQYQEIMLKLADLYLHKGRVQECQHLARRVLKLDPFLEEGYQLMLQAFAALHDSAGMTLQYRQYQEIMKNELGLQPSVEMKALYQQLLATI